jgi:hypothetical protein
MPPRSRARSVLAVALGLALSIAAGITATGCGPKERFCPDAGDGVCRPPPDAHIDMGIDAPVVEMGSMYIGMDAGAD